MPTIKTNIAFNKHGLDANIIGSMLVTAAIEGKSYVSIRDFIQVGMTRDQVEEAILNLEAAGVLHLGSIPGLTELEKMDGLSVQRITVGCEVQRTVQPEMNFLDPMNAEFQIGNGLYRGVIDKENILNITRFTFKMDGDERVFTRIRHLVKDEQHKSFAEAQGALQAFQDQFSEFSEEAKSLDLVKANGRTYELYEDSNLLDVTEFSIRASDPDEPSLMREVWSEIETNITEEEAFERWEAYLDEVMPTDKLDASSTEKQFKDLEIHDEGETEEAPAEAPEPTKGRRGRKGKE